MKLLRKLATDWTDDEQIKFVFDHLRNLGICAAVWVAGIYVGRVPDVASAQFGRLTKFMMKLEAGMLFGLGAILFSMLFGQFLRKTREMDLRTQDRFLLVMMYVCFATLAFLSSLVVGRS